MIVGSIAERVSAVSDNGVLLMFVTSDCEDPASYISEKRRIL
jgi:hypothetical protein